MTETRTPLDTYHASFQLDPTGQWLAELEEIPEVHTFGRTLGKAREYLVDALASWLDVPVDKVRDRVEFHMPELPDHVHETVQRALAERAIAEAVNKVAGDLVGQASVALVDEAHLSMRDAAEILGLSHQRVQQLVAAARPGTLDRRVTVKKPAEDIARSLRRYLPHGSKEELGTVASSVALGLAIAWIESRSR